MPDAASVPVRLRRSRSDPCRPPWAPSGVPHPRRRAPRGSLAWAAALACAAWAAPVLSQVRTDGSVGPAARTLTGPAYLIPQNLGRLAGTNLFHSFEQFSIGRGESATFFTTTPGITHVISRVTGGSPTLIEGLLQLRAADGRPGFYFINPAGVTFGAGAAVDVPGTFHVSTADALVFPDGRFHADPRQASSFSSAPPEAFGFLGRQRAAVRFEPGSFERDGQVLLLPPGSISAGDVTIDGAALLVRGGDLKVAAVGAQALDLPLAGPAPALSGEVSLTRQALLSMLSRDESERGSLQLSAGTLRLADQSSVRSVVGERATGRGGDIDITLQAGLSAAGDSGVWTETLGAADAGAIRVRAASLQLETGGYLYSVAPSLGRTGLIEVGVPGAITLTGGASISTEVAGAAAGQGIRLRAGRMAVDGAAYVRATTSGSGAGGDLAMVVDGALTLGDGATVATVTSGSADAGAIRLQAGSFLADGGARVASRSLETATGRAGAVELTVAGDAVVGAGATLVSNTASSAVGGDVRVRAAQLLLDGGQVLSTSTAAGGGGSGRVEITLSGRLTMRNRAAIDSSTIGTGPAGAITLRVGEVALEGASRVSSKALDGTGAAGSIDLVTAGALVMREESTLSTGTSTDADAGALRVVADSIRLESGARIDSAAGLDSSGRGGNVSVTAAGALVMRDGASIAANTAGTGKAGNVTVGAGSVSMDGRSSVSTVGISGTGDAGQVTLTAAGDLSLTNGAAINADAFGAGRSGSIDLQARDVVVDSGSRIGSIGDAGRITIVARGNLSVLGTGEGLDRSGVISTSTLSAGNAGAIDIRAENVLIDGVGAVISSQALPGSTGHAGSIGVTARGELLVRQGGINSSTGGAGAAGSVSVHAARVVLSGERSGLVASGLAGSGGQVGNLQVLADEAIVVEQGAFVSIANLAIVPDAASRPSGSLRLAAPDIVLRDGAVVSAAAIGNVAASTVTVEAGRRLALERAGITTSANEGNGGAIRIVARNAAVSLDDSIVTTSVQGSQGNGGDIELSARTLLMDTGFIQANTAARAASGGLVRIDAGALVASGNTVFVGGDTPLLPRAGLFGYNVIQAAAPTGVSGVVELTSPVLDLTGSLRGLRAEVVDAGGLGRSPCQTSGSSTLALAGRGGLPVSTRGPQRAEREVPGLAVAAAEPPLWLASAPAAGAAGPRSCL